MALARPFGVANAICGRKSHSPRENAKYCTATLARYADLAKLYAAAICRLIPVQSFNGVTHSAVAALFSADWQARTAEPGGACADVGDYGCPFSARGRPAGRGAGRLGDDREP